MWGSQSWLQPPFRRLKIPKGIPVKPRSPNHVIIRRPRPGQSGQRPTINRTHDAEGKAIASQNSTKHGFTSTKVVVPGESQEEFDNFREGILESLDPQSAHEDELSDRVVAAMWRLKRFNRLENAFFADRINAIQNEMGIEDPDAAGAMLFTDPQQMKRMSLFLRYMTATQRECNKAKSELEKEQKRRVQAEFEQAALEPMQAEPVEPGEPVGSVSQAPVGQAILPAAAFQAASAQTGNSSPAREEESNPARTHSVYSR
jgi:hypothetical protein